MRVRAALGIVGAVTASAAVSAVALGQGSTWGRAARANVPDVPEAGAVPSTPTSTWGAAPASESLESHEAGAPELTEPVDASPPALAHPPADAGSPAKNDDSGAPGADASDGGGGGSGPTEVGFSVALFGGYSLPFGSAVGSPLNEVAVGMVPVGAEAGWFFSPHLYLGAYFLYGFGIGANLNNDQCSGVNVGCSTTMYRIGVVGHWHFNPLGQWDPWVGVGLGYEALLNTETNSDDGSSDLASGAYGIDLSLLAGIEYKPLRYLGVGPYVELATGPYVADSQGEALFQMHGWLSLGLRLHTNL